MRKYTCLLAFLVLLTAFGSSQIMLKNGEKVGRTVSEEKVRSERFSGLSKMSGETTYGLLQVEGRNINSIRKNLESEGVKFFEYIPEDAWIVSIPEDMLDNPPEDAKFVVEFRPDYKISRDADQSNELYVRCFPDVSREICRESLGKFDDVRRAGKGFLVGPGVRPENLAEIEEVFTVDRKLPGLETMNSGSRNFLGAGTVQETPYSLKGEGFTAAMWDGGWAGDHQDINHSLEWSDKVILGDKDNCDLDKYEGYTSCGVNDHPTHVAGTMLGGGNLENELRGMAPESRLVTYDFPDPNNIVQDQYSETFDAVNNHDAVLSQNSWGYTADETILGEYTELSAVYDNLTRRTSDFEGVLHIFSVGNSRKDFSFEYNTTVGPGGTSKNTVSVGAVKDDGSSTVFSSWGPTEDGRIKPELVAAGFEINSTYPGDFYATMSGTSSSAPAVSGVTLLLTQAFNNSYGLLPRPSMSKALLIHTAEDLRSEGPDYRTGWGSPNITEAVELLNTSSLGGSLVNGSMASTGNWRNYTFFKETDENANFTLVWSDYPASSSAAKTLVNDLDLKVFSGGKRYFPWTLQGFSDPDAPAKRDSEDHTNPVETVHVDDDRTQIDVGVYSHNLPEPEQSFSLVSSAEPVTQGTPSIFVESPFNMTYYGREISFNISVNKKVEGVNLSLDGGDNISMANDTLYHYHVRENVSEGSHNARFFVKDSEGNTNSSNVTFTVKLPPEISIKSPVNGSNLSEVFWVNATYSDFSGIDSAVFKINNETGEQFSGIINGTVDSSNFADGEYSVVFNVTDNDNISTVNSSEVVFDNTKPVIIPKRPVNGSFVGGSFDVEAVLRDLTGGRTRKFEVYNSSGIFISGSFNSTETTANLEDGVYGINFSGTDNAGNTGFNNSTVFSVDDTGPKINVLSPSKYFVGSEFYVNATAEDEGIDEIGGITYVLTNSSGNITGNRSINTTLDSETFSDGEYGIRFFAWDGLNNTNDTETKVFVDNTPPNSTGSFNFTLSNFSRIKSSPAVFSVISSEAVGFNWTGYDPSYELKDENGVDHLRLSYRKRVFNVTTQSLEEWGNWSVYNSSINASASAKNLTEAVLESGFQYEFGLEAVDSAGNTEKSNRLNVTVDAVPPKFSEKEGVPVVSPFNWTNKTGEMLSLNITNIAGINTTVGSENGMINLSFYNGSGRSYPGVKLFPEEEGFVEHRVSTIENISLENGKRYNVSLSAGDCLGTFNNSLNYSFGVDNITPIFEKNVSDNNFVGSSGWYRDNVTVFTNCSERGISGIKKRGYSLGDVENSFGTEGVINHSINVSGSNDYRFFCTDYAGNTNSSVSSLKIDTRTPEIEATYPGNNSLGVPVEFGLTLEFSDESNESGIDRERSEISISGGSISGIGWNNSSVEADVSGLDYSSEYQVSGRIVDKVNHSQEFMIEFETEEDSDSDSDGSSSGSSSSSGGFVPSADEDEEVEEKTFTDVSKGEKLVYNFTEQGVFGLLDVSFVSGENRSNTVLTARKQGSRPEETSETGFGEVYRYLDVDLGVSASDVVFRFPVNRTWVENRDINVSEIRFLRWDGSWDVLDTELLDEDDERYVFRAFSEGFSYFAVVGEKNVEEAVEKNFCGDGICDDDENWQNCSSDCNKPEEVLKAEISLRRAEETIDNSSEEWGLVLDARKRFEEGNYSGADELSETAIKNYYEGRTEERSYLYYSGVFMVLWVFVVGVVFVGKVLYDRYGERLAKSL